MAGRLVLGLVLAFSWGAVIAAPAPDGLELPGVNLGMTLDAWKALSFPGADPAHVEPVCTDHSANPEYELVATAADRKAGVVVCAYLGRYGRFTLPQAIVLGPEIQARRLRFTFVKGRLSSIEYRTSVNVYNDLTARLNARYGPTVGVVRDSIKTELGPYPRVRQAWNTPRGRIELTDPVRPVSDMSVRLSATTDGLPGRAS